MILSDAFNLIVSQLQTQRVMTSIIRSRMEYIIRTYHILILILQSKFMEKCNLNGWF